MKVPMLLKNKYVLYSLLLIGVVNVLGYIALEDYNSMGLIIVLGVLSSYFSKNMSVNLLIAIVGTSLVAVNNKITEGFVEGKGKDAEAKKSYGSSKETSKEKEKIAKKSDILAAKEARAQRTNEKQKKQQQQQRAVNNAKAKEQVDDKSFSCAKGTTCPKGKECGDQSQCSKQGFQNNVPPSSPASVDGTDESDESIGERIDYASTMEQAYDNLQKMLGEGGMQGLTTETKKLVSQQKNLMSTLNSMAPVLNTAKETLEGMNLPDMGEITTLMKKFTGGSKK